MLAYKFITVALLVASATVTVRGNGLEAVAQAGAVANSLNGLLNGGSSSSASASSGYNGGLGGSASAGSSASSSASNTGASTGGFGFGHHKGGLGAIGALFEGFKKLGGGLGGSSSGGLGGGYGNSLGGGASSGGSLGGGLGGGLGGILGGGLQGSQQQEGSLVVPTKSQDSTEVKANVEGAVANKEEEAGFLGTKSGSELIKLLLNPLEFCARIAKHFKISLEKFFPLVTKGINFGLELAAQPLVLSFKIIEKVFVPDTCKLRFCCNVARTFSFTKDIVPTLSDRVLSESKLVRAYHDGIHGHSCETLYPCNADLKLRDEYKGQAEGQAEGQLGGHLGHNHHHHHHHHQHQQGGESEKQGYNGGELEKQSAGEYKQQSAGEYKQQSSGEYKQQSAGEYKQQSGGKHKHQHGAEESLRDGYQGAESNQSGQQHHHHHEPIFAASNLVKALKKN